MSQKHRKLINEGIDEANKHRVTTNRCFKVRKWIGLFGTIAVTGLMLSAPTSATSPDANLIVGRTDSYHEPAQEHFESLEEAAGQGVKLIRSAQSSIATDDTGGVARIYL